MKDDKSIILVVTGTFGSGKDTIGEYLVRTRNFAHISSSDLVREESQKRHGSIERHFLLETANNLRRTRGTHILGEMSYEKYLDIASEHPAGAVISGLRNVAGTEYIISQGGVLVFVDAPIEVRYQRMQSRQRDAESTYTLEQFRVNEEKELEGGRGNEEPNILRVKENADYHLENSGTLEEFEEQIDAVLQTVVAERQQQ